HELQGPGPPALVGAERERREDVDRAALDERPRAGRLGIRVLVGDPQGQPPGRTRGAAYPLGPDLYLVEVEAGGDLVALLDGLVRRGPAGQVEQGTPAGAV